MRILIVEDEQALREQLVGQLQESGFVAEAAGDGEEGLYLASEYDYDCAVIDLGLPKLSGIELIRAAREAGRKFPILILTARGRWQVKGNGLEVGADDYLVKPFHYEELLARLNALVRRAAGWTQPKRRFGPLTLDTRASQILLDGAPVELTAYEYRIAEYLMLHAGKVISKTELTEHVYDQDFDRDSNVIEVFIGRLRKKLDPGGKTQPIETQRGRGYRFTLQADGD